MDRKLLIRQIAALAAVILVFSLLNAGLFVFLTSRLANNFSGTDQAKMVDVKKYLPFEEGSDLPRIETDFRLTGELPVLDGAAALVPVYAAIIDNVYPEGSVTYEGGVFSDDNFYGENFAPDSKMQYRNTIRGYNAMLDGTADIFFGAQPSAEQRQTAEDRGIELISVPVGREAFVFFVNSENPVDGLTSEQVRMIYAGKIRNWAQVGGVDRPINPVTRLAGSGSQNAMERFMGNVPFGQKSPLAVIGGSLGYSFRYYLVGMVGNGNVKMLALDGVAPSAENIGNGSYPVIAPFYAIYRADNGNDNVPLLIEWLLSDEGQEIIEKTGYVRK